MLVPAAIGIGLCNATLIALVSNAADRREQGRVQGAAGALESLGRTIGPIWGNAVLQEVGEGAAYGAAAGSARRRGRDGRTGIIRHPGVAELRRQIPSQERGSWELGHKDVWDPSTPCLLAPGS